MWGVHFIFQTLQSMNIVMTDKVGRVGWLSDQRKPVKKKKWLSLYQPKTKIIDKEKETIMRTKGAYRSSFVLG